MIESSGKESEILCLSKRSAPRSASVTGEPSDFLIISRFKSLKNESVNSPASLAIDTAKSTNFWSTFIFLPGRFSINTVYEVF